MEITNDMVDRDKFYIAYNKKNSSNIFFLVNYRDKYFWNDLSFKTLEISNGIFEEQIDYMMKKKKWVLCHFDSQQKAFEYIVNLNCKYTQDLSALCYPKFS